MDKKYLNTADTARYFSVTTATVLNWEKNGLIACLKIGKTRRFALSDIQAFERSYCKKTGVNE